MIECTNLGVRFGQRVVFAGLDLALPPGTTTAILGPSGSPRRSP